MLSMRATRYASRTFTPFTDATPVIGRAAGRRSTMMATPSLCVSLQAIPVASELTSAQRRGASVARAATSAAEVPAATGEGTEQRCLITTSVTASTVAAFLEEIKEATASGVDIIELRLDFIKDFDTQRDLPTLMSACTIPYIVTYRPKWEGGNYEGPEPQRLATLKLAALSGAPYVDVEFKAAHVFFAGAGEVPPECRLILSSHDFQKTPSEAFLHQLADDMRAAGADIVKIACFANDITDCAKVLSVLQRKDGPTIALAMGEKGQIVRLLAAKYGGYLTFAAMSAARASAPGQPTIQQMKSLYRFDRQRPSTKVYGIIGNPVHHSRSPLIHNAAFEHIGFDGVYVPLLVDSLDAFLKSFEGHDFGGFSVTIPHKEAAAKAAGSADPTAAQIGAINTLIKQADGSFRGYNTDMSAAIGAIEARLGGASSSGASPLAGKTFVLVGAGGAGRALAYGAAAKGAKVLIANRSHERAVELAAAVGTAASAVLWEDLQAGRVSGDVLGNSTSVGMVPNVEETPVPAAALKNFKLVFDAVYTPRATRLLRDAKDAGCQIVDGVEMFVGQAVQQFELFTGHKAPVALMEKTLLDAMAAKK